MICEYCITYGDNAHFLDNKNTCVKCASGCMYCTGPSVHECAFPSSGYFYKNSSRAIEKCPAGCNRCDQNNNCISCLRGYKPVRLSADKSNDFVKCVQCSNTNCAYCQDHQEFGILKEEVCTACIENFGKVGKDKCEACPPYCAYCGNDSKKCLMCAEGFTNHAVDKSKCIMKEDPDCMLYDDKNFSCINCKFGSFLDKNKFNIPNKAGCTDCSEITPGCAFCREIRVGEYDKNAAAIKFRDTMRCSACSDGYHLDETTGGCIENMENCKFYVNGSCNRCNPGLSVQDGKCLPITVPNCNEESKIGEC
jgi:hypothetical protein